MLFFIYIGVRGVGVGLLLWPAVVVYTILILRWHFSPILES